MILYYHLVLLDGGNGLEIRLEHGSYSTYTPYYSTTEIVYCLQIATRYHKLRCDLIHATINDT